MGETFNDSIHSRLLYTALGQAFPGASLTKSQQEKEDEQKNDLCLRGVVCDFDVGRVRASGDAQMTGSERETGDVLVYCQLAVSADDCADMDPVVRATGTGQGVWPTER